jgi:outer membrane immunogenic protein
VHITRFRSCLRAGIPLHQIKTGVDYAVTPALKLGSDVILVSSQWYVGDDANQNVKLADYWVANLHGSYQLTDEVQIYGFVKNLFNRKFATFGTYFNPQVIANAIPDPPTDHRMVTPAQPLSIYIGLRGKLTANAADVVPPYAPPPSVYVPPAFTWTGFYLGGNLGAGWALNTVTDTQLGLNLSNGSNNGAFIGGGQLGLNWQVSNVVLGFEWDFDRVANNNNTGNGLLIPTVGTIQVTPNNNWITTLAARFGMTNGHWLSYGKVGGGWVGNDNFTITNVTPGASITGSNRNTNSGWLMGAGIEWAFANHWSAKLEYDYLGLGSRTFTVPAGSPFLANDVFTVSNRNIQMVKVGINYLFNWGKS